MSCAMSWVVATVLLAAAPAAAQAYRSPLSAFPDAASDPRWQGVAFPARQSRRYARAPNGEGLAQRQKAYEPHFEEAARTYKLPISFLKAVAHVESHFYADALSVDGAMGVMQLMPFTVRKMGVTRPEDARQSILGGARFLRILANRWRGDLVLTTASYNAGPGAVAKYGGVPPFPETLRYVRRVLDFYAYYRREPRVP